MVEAVLLPSWMQFWKITVHTCHMHITLRQSLFELHAILRQGTLSTARSKVPHICTTSVRSQNFHFVSLYKTAFQITDHLETYALRDFKRHGTLQGQRQVPHICVANIAEP